MCVVEAVESDTCKGGDCSAPRYSRFFINCMICIYFTARKSGGFVLSRPNNSDKFLCLSLSRMKE